MYRSRLSNKFLNTVLKFRSIKKTIDHIVYIVSDLEEAMHDFEKKLGVRPIFGGHHNTFGTKNALINLKNKMYLELLAADDANTEIQPPRWMGIDLLTKNQIARWALKSDALEKEAQILKTYNPAMGQIKSGSRNSPDGSLLQWELLMPLASPEVELIPFFLDWSNTEKHPSELLPDMHCELIALYATHPQPESFDPIFESLEYSLHCKPSNEIGIKAIIKCPNGILEI